MARSDAIRQIDGILGRREEALRDSLKLECSVDSHGDSSDNAVGGSLAQIDSTLKEGESRELAKIVEARNRIREGTFGICEECELEIPIARTQALPYATRCINCQRESERNQFRGTLHSPRFQMVKDGDPNTEDLPTIDSVE